MDKKFFLILLLCLALEGATVKSELYSIRFEDITIMFPTKPVIVDEGTRREQYVSETDTGIFTASVRREDSVAVRVEDTVLIGRYDDPVISANRDLDVGFDAFVEGMSNDPNLGTLTDVVKFTRGKMQGRYFRFEMEYSNEPTYVIVFIQLLSIESPNTYSICYQYADDGNEEVYSKQELLALIKE